MAAAESKEHEKLVLDAVVGFGGKVPWGLVYHPDGNHILYPLGSTIVVKNLRTNTQAFMQGHSDKISCLALSRDGRYAASGQVTNMGFKAMVIVWDVAAAIALGNSGGDASGVELHRLLLHKVKVQDLAFSANSAFLATLGGADDNNLVVWDVATGKAVCGSPAASHAVTTVRWYNTRDDALVTAGQYNMRSWEFDAGGRKLRPTECSLGSLKRVVDSLAIDGTDTFAYCGCKTGDILEVNLAAARFTRASKNRFSLGVSVITWVPSGAGSGSLIVGAGDGAIARVPLDSFGVTASAQLAGAVSSIAPSPDGSHVYVGTGAGNTYTVDLESLAPELRGTAHADPVRDVAFPVGESALFVTASFGELRLWNAVTRAELLRIEVPNVDACCVAVMPNGSAIVSGWSDGKVRAFLPESGRLLYTITDAHPEGVSALTITHDNARLITGGKDGRVRVWNVAGSTQTMEMSFKEHKGTVTCVRVTKNDEEALSASVDGSCIIWNLRRGVRGNALFASTQFKSVLLHPDESQILTCGSDRKITYWDSADCNAIRIIESSADEVAALDIAADGVSFVSGGADKLVKLWAYDEGSTLAVGVGHSGAVSQVKIAPDGQKIVTVGAEGAIFVWAVPESVKRGSGYVPKAHVADEVDDAAAGIAADRAARLGAMERGSARGGSARSGRK